jgi:hypothetical protein
MRARAFLLMLLAVPATFGPACVVHARPPVDAAALARAGRDFSGTEARVLLALKATRDPAARKRLSATWDLLEGARDWPDGERLAVLAFVNQLMDAEAEEASADVGVAPTPEHVRSGVVEEPGAPDGVILEPAREVGPLPGSVVPPEPGTSVAPVAPVAPLAPLAPVAPLAPGAPNASGAPVDPRLEWDAAVGRARAALEGNHADVALQELATVPDLRQVEGGLELSREAQDAFVRGERERAAQLFLKAREITEPEARRTALEEVRGLLTDLLRKWPDSPYASAIGKNLDRVEKELEKLPAAHP